MLIFRRIIRVSPSNTRRVEEFLVRQLLPLARDLGISNLEIWKNRVGDQGEFMELWTFPSTVELEQKRNELEQSAQWSKARAELDRWTNSARSDLMTRLELEQERPPLPENFI